MIRLAILEAWHDNCPTWEPDPDKRDEDEEQPKFKFIDWCDQDACYIRCTACGDQICIRVDLRADIAEEPDNMSQWPGDITEQP